MRLPSRTRLIVCIFALPFVVKCSSIVTTESVSTTTPPRPDSKKPIATQSTGNKLSIAKAQLARARYGTAETNLEQIIAEEPNLRSFAEVSLSELLRMTGRREKAIELALPHCKIEDETRLDACFTVAEALRSQGDLDRAVELLRPYSELPNGRRIGLLLADILAEKGLLSEARLRYKALVSDYNENRFNRADTSQIAITGRAAHRLGAFHDANELFNQAERSGVSDLETLLFRGELYLDAHDPKHARAVADEALNFAPDHPSALLLFAKVRLAETRDTQSAERHAERVLAINPTNADAYFVLAGLSLRDLDYENTHRFIDAGLKQEPRHLDLLSLRAAAFFLADENARFQETLAEVLKRNPDYSRLFRIIAEYAEAEHRYGDTIPLLRRAAALDPNDSQVHAQLGIQLVRSGEETEGRRELIRAFAQDPFDLRVRNTLVLYEREIDHAYSSYSKFPFVVRVPEIYKTPLEQFITPFMLSAYDDLSRRYGKLENPNIRLELYANQESFGVRTSGVPASFLQGVCFGTTIVARLPLDEPVNVGMTLFHELSHVFHLQLSNHRVPRWFTEGLAEYETKRRRPEWSREQEINVYEAFVAKKIPNIVDLNRAFSHATSMNDLAVAYIASTYVVEHLIDRFGFRIVPKLLKGWKQGLPTSKVLPNVLGVSIENLNREFSNSLHRRFAHFDGQYLPPSKFESIELAKVNLGKTPTDPRRIATLAQLEILSSHVEECRKIIDKAPREVAKHADILWVRSLLEIAELRPLAAISVLDELLKAGFDGYFVRIQRALAFRLHNDVVKEKLELSKAFDFQPTASEPLYRLAALAREDHDLQTELNYVTLLCKLEESDVRLHRRRVELELSLGYKDRAWNATEALRLIDPLDVESQILIGNVAMAKGDRGAAQKARDLAAMLTSGNGYQERPVDLSP
jgi:tetratricopeptide (TPR) repeat protein